MVSLSGGRRRILSDSHTLLVLTISVFGANERKSSETHAQGPPSPPLSFSCQALDSGGRNACRHARICTRVCACVAVRGLTQASGTQVCVIDFPSQIRPDFCLTRWFWFQFFLSAPLPLLFPYRDLTWAESNQILLMQFVKL